MENLIQSAMLLPNIDKIMQKKSFIYSIKILTVCLLFHFQAIGQHPLLQSGPMPGYADMLEVMIWVQTTEAARVEILYQAEGKSDGPFHSNVVHTKKEKAFTAHLIADTLEPGQRYTYKLFINNELVSLPYPTDFQTQKTCDLTVIFFSWLMFTSTPIPGPAGISIVPSGLIRNAGSTISSR